MQRSLRALSAETTATHKLGQIQAKGHTEQLYKLRREVNDVADRVKSGLSPALAGSASALCLHSAQLGERGHHQLHRIPRRRYPAG